MDGVLRQHENVVPGRAYTQPSATNGCATIWRRADAVVRKCIPVPMLRHVEAALVSAVFNIGPSVVCGSHAAAAGDGERLAWRLRPAIARWDAAAGRQMRGLIAQARDERTRRGNQSLGTRRLIAGLASGCWLVVAGFISAR